MVRLLTRGVVLEQHKEPALSRDLREFATGAPVPLDLPPAEDPAALGGEEILRYARLAGIIDERDGAPLGDKLAEGRGAALLVADAMDDEPYVSSQMGPLFKLSQQAVQGLWLAARAAGCAEAQAAVCRSADGVRMKIPATLYGVRVKRMTGKYPVEARERFGGQKGGALLVGVCALIHLYRAVHRGVRQTTAFVTVAGNCVANPQNLEVGIGTTAQQALERCGLIEEPGRVVLGGPMTGESVAAPEEAPIAATTRAVLAFRDDARLRERACIGCGRCVRACPQGLSPVYLYKAAQVRHVRLLREYDATWCTRCGTCSYVCPAGLNLSTGIGRAAEMIRALDARAAALAGEGPAQKEGSHAKSV